ncbi:hypothetical protein LCGC14_0861130 [marine sediment metagenome]|uniref:SF3 helicase domain-containing protein n=1 Tax=marine sediment metagenome TaxID=412755 RepID=A0A0F9SEH1_9ZZZZ
MVWKDETKEIYTEEPKEENIFKKEYGNTDDEFTYIEKTKGRDGEVKETVKVSIGKVSRYLLTKFNFKTIFGSKTDKIYFYESGMYIPKGKTKIKTEVEYLLDNKCTTHIVNEIIEKIKRKTEIDEDLFETFSENNLDLIPLKNGVYSIKEEKLLDHSEENLFTFQIPINYNPKSKCELFEKFLDEVLYPEEIEVMKEWFGFHLYRRYFIKKGIILLGEKDTGKTTLLDILIGFIGEKNKTGMALQTIAGGSDFTKLSLKDKHANIHDDLSSKDLSDGGGFKIATGGGHISAEVKFGDYVQFVPFAKQSHATNKIPPNKDVDDMAYYSRWMPFQLDNVILKPNPYLKDEIISKELSGVLNMALEKLKYLLKKNKFSYIKTDEEVKVIMERSGNPLIAFVSDVLEESENGIITKEEMYQVYSEWAKNTENLRLSKEQLGRNLEKNCKFIIAKKGTQKQGRYWNNVNLKGNYSTFLTSKKVIYLQSKDDVSLLQYNKNKSVESDVKEPEETKEEEEKIEQVKIK